MDQNNLSEEQLKEIRKQKLQQLGYPIPLDKPAFMPQVTNVKDPKMLSKIEQIRQGKHRQEFAQFRSQTGEAPKHNPNQRQIPPPQQLPGGPAGNIPSQPGKVAPPPLLEFTAGRSQELEFLERDLATTPTTSSYVPGMPATVEDGGKGFVDNIRQKFHSNMQQKRMQEQTVFEQPYTQPVYTQQPVMQQIPALQSGMMLINEEDLKKKIINISKQVAKQISEQMIRAVLTEWTKTNKNPIVENDRIKKAEILGNNLVKIDGKTFRLEQVATKKVQGE